MFVSPSSPNRISGRRSPGLSPPSSSADDLEVRRSDPRARTSADRRRGTAAHGSDRNCKGRASSGPGSRTRPARRASGPAFEPRQHGGDTSLPHRRLVTRRSHEHPGPPSPALPLGLLAEGRASAPARHPCCKALMKSSLADVGSSRLRRRVWGWSSVAMAEALGIAVTGMELVAPTGLSLAEAWPRAVRVGPASAPSAASVPQGTPVRRARKWPLSISPPRCVPRRTRSSWEPAFAMPCVRCWGRSR